MRFNLQQEYIEACDQVNRLAQTLKERDVEIARLKETNETLKAHMSAAGLVLKQKNQLITELADVLWGVTCDMHGGAPEKTPELIQRAREATK